MNEGLRKGWCPGALRPMMARDGLLVRLRITGGNLSASRARALAGLAQRHGNGLFDLSARANVQMRGVGADALPALLEGLDELGLLDASIESESVRNVLASPLAGLGGRFDIRPFVGALERRLVDDAALHRLPAKFVFLVDDGAAPSLAGISADVRFDWNAAEKAFAVGLGGTRREAVFAGYCAAEAMVARAADLSRSVVALQRGDKPMRMRALLNGIRTDAQSRLGVQPRPTPDHPARDHDEIFGPQRFDGCQTLGAGAPFGRLDAAMLRGLADAAEHEGIGDLRLTPWRAVLVPLPTGASGPASLARSRLAAVGFILDPADPRLRVAACSGQSCLRGTTPTHADAAALASLAPAGKGTWLHVSGCEKGCAKPSPSAMTLVGRDGCYDLVRNGRPGDAPSLTGLDLASIRDALARVAEPA